jgi:hypothetical protein
VGPDQCVHGFVPGDPIGAPALYQDDGYAQRVMARGVCGGLADDAPTKTMIDGLIARRVLWGPIAGYYTRHSDPPLTVVLLWKEHGVPRDFRIFMGVRHSDWN